MLKKTPYPTRTKVKLAKIEVSVVKKHTFCGAVHVLILARPQGPDEGGKPHAAEEQGHGHEVEKRLHQASSSTLWRVTRPKRGSSQPLRVRNRMAFAITRSEEPDMASAAISGVTWPEIAMGTARTL